MKAEDYDVFLFLYLALPHYSIIDITGQPASPELAMAGRHNESRLEINPPYFWRINQSHILLA
jgi:hypothetical protein